MFPFPPPPPPPPPPRPQWKYDVFVSFRGEDLRGNFMSHLFSAFKNASILSFRDDARDGIAKEIASNLFEGIWHARFALIMFSRNYADSKWCMNELLAILECNTRYEKHGHLVVPVFLNVKPEDISKLTNGSEFAQGFERLCRNKGDDGQIQKWRDALRETKHLLGFDLRNDAGGNEGILVHKIVEYLLNKIRETQPPYLVQNAIGMESLVKEVISLINKGQEGEVRVIGICGVEGIGKTMAARIICEHIRCDFECFVFLDKIEEADSNNHAGIVGLQKKLLHNLIKVEGLMMHDDIQTNITEIIRHIHRKRILLVLDDVTKKEQIDYFGAGERELLCPGSRTLIITTKQKLLKDIKVDDKYIVEGLKANEALELLRHHALNREEPQGGYDEIFRSLAQYVGGHPASLKWLGSFLNGKSKHKYRQTLEMLVRSPYLDSLSHSFWSVEPYGGQGGDAFDDGTHTGVRQIRLYGQSVIEMIAIDYDQNGCLVRSLQHGERVHGNEKLVILDHPSEYLISVSGHIDDYRGHDVVRSLKIHSNKKTYGPFGSERGWPFDLSHSDGRIIGFHGKCSCHLHSIGAHFGPISHTYPFDVVGPFGGDNDMDAWNDGKHTDVRQIVIGFDSAIKSISTLYDKHGRPIGPFTHGTIGGGKTYTIMLDYPSEYLTSISGYTEKVSGLVILQSLTIHTNRRVHGPIGTANKGSHFSFPHTGGKIVGFYGSCDGPRLASIGAFYEPIPHTHPFKVCGPFGGDRGGPLDDGTYIDINRIFVRYSDFIYSIDFDYVNTDGSTRSTTPGRNLGGYTYEVKLDHPNEFMTSISGFFTDRITLLAFQTNKRILGPIGREEGEYFCLPAGKVIRVSQRTGDYLESIGAHVEPYYPFKSGWLFGRSEESNWDDGNKHTTVRKIIIEFEPSKGPLIRSIMFQYEEENKELWQSETHGGIHGNKFHIVRNVHTIQIRDPGEYLTSISGYFSFCGITSLTFQTNKKTIGPFGDEMGWHFSSPATGGRIVGFYGRSGECLEAIGAYFEPISHLYPIKSIGPFGGLGGQAWDDGKFNGVREFEVTHNDVIHCIKFVYDKSGERVCLGPHGGQTKGDEAKVIKVRLDYPREYLMSISGYKREDDDCDIDNAIVQSLTFHSNTRIHGPFGVETGKYFWYPSTRSKIIGFYGRCGETLNSIGVYAEPISHLYPFKTVGPFGGSGGTLWDDGVNTDVRGFRVIAHDVIRSISFYYDNLGSIEPCSRGSIVPCSEHGRGDGPWVDLDYPKERLISISGFVKGNGNTSDTTIHDLKIDTTKDTYGPYACTGESEDVRRTSTSFIIPSEGNSGRIVGFFGRMGSHLNSIGARLEP